MRFTQSGGVQLKQAALGSDGGIPAFILSQLERSRIFKYSSHVRRHLPGRLSSQNNYIKTTRNLWQGIPPNLRLYETGKDRRMIESCSVAQTGACKPGGGMKDTCRSTEEAWSPADHDGVQWEEIASNFLTYVNVPALMRVHYGPDRVLSGMDR
jgi:hypothetical protein